jgi:hypothetical protein
MQIKVPSFHPIWTFLIVVSIIPFPTRPLHGQDLSSILKNQVPGGNPINPGSNPSTPTAPSPSKQPYENIVAPGKPGASEASLDILRGVPSHIASGPRDPLEPYLWNIQMAEMSFAINNDATSYGRLITARIHLIEAACLKTSFDGSKAAATEQCTKIRELILNDFANAPAAVCARDGMNSPTCKEAHLKLPLEDFKYFPTQKEKAENDFIGISDPTEIINTASTELSSILYNIDPTSKENADEAKSKALALGSKILKLACPEENYAVLPLDRKKEMKPQKIEILKMERPTPANTRTVATPTISPNEPQVLFTPVGFELVRLIDQQCREQIKKLRVQIPDAASLVCAEQGRFSPACQDAITAEDGKYKKNVKPAKGRPASRQVDPKEKIFKTF